MRPIERNRAQGGISSITVPLQEMGPGRALEHSDRRSAGMSSQVVRKFLTGALLALTVGLIVPALASADAPDIQTATGTSSIDASGNVVVTLGGTWAWTTHHSNCNLDRAGVGIAVDWGDNNGNHVTTLGADSIDVGVRAATLLNNQDNAVHNTSGGTGLSGFTCGTFNGSFNTGTFTGMTHTYPAGSTIPQICALAYDVHGKNGTASGIKEVTAGGANHNSDNSAEKNASTPGGNQCFTIVLPNHPSVTTDAGPDVTVGSTVHDTATLSGGSNDISGTITFTLYGPNDATCANAPIFTTTKTVTGNGQYVSANSQVINQAGTYRWIANYGGDANNSVTNNLCNATNENVTVASHPQIQVDKSGPGSALAGSDVEFTLDVSNPGDVPLHNVVVDDSRCNATPPTLDTKHGDASPTTLDPGDLWTYKCTAHTSAGDTSLHNVVNSCALPPAGQQVCDDNFFDVPLP